MELKKFPQSRKVHHPAKDPQSSNFSIEAKTNTSIMADEVYEGAIGIDLGKFHYRCKIATHYPSYNPANFFSLIGTTYSCGTSSKPCANKTTIDICD
jgi:hypothetical protein